MSAQIITALRKRAAALDAEAARFETAEVSNTTAGARSPGNLRLIADEFRTLADQAEAR